MATTAVDLEIRDHLTPLTRVAVDLIEGFVVSEADLPPFPDEPVRVETFKHGSTIVSSLFPTWELVLWVGAVVKAAADRNVPRLKPEPAGGGGDITVTGVSDPATATAALLARRSPLVSAPSLYA